MNWLLFNMGGIFCIFILVIYEKLYLSKDLLDFILYIGFLFFLYMKIIRLYLKYVVFR